MCVIMSMNVLMPSWSYLLLMSNVLFIHSLGIRLFEIEGVYAVGHALAVLLR